MGTAAFFAEGISTGELIDLIHIHRHRRFDRLKVKDTVVIFAHPIHGQQDSYCHCIRYSAPNPLTCRDAEEKVQTQAPIPASL